MTGLNLPSILLVLHVAKSVNGFLMGNSLRSQSLVGKYPGTLILGGLFPLHERTFTRPPQCGLLSHERGIHLLEAMYYALDMINADQRLLPGIQLGADVRDTCNQDVYALNASLHFTLNNFVVNKTCQGNRPHKKVRNNRRLIVGVIGAASSSNSLEVASIFRLFEMPLVSYASTSVILNNRLKYGFLVRTVPPDTFQAQALVDVIKSFGWKSAFLVFSEGSYGEMGAEAVSKFSEKGKICIVSSHKVNQNTNYTSIIESFQKYQSTNIVILFCQVNHVIPLLQEAKNYSRHFTWLASDFWGTREKFLRDYKLTRVANNAITIRLETKSLPGFREYFSKLSPLQNFRNPWFQQFWEEQFNCTLKETPRKRLCPTSYKFPTAYHFDDKVPYVIDAVWAQARALDKVYRRSCPSLNRICYNFTKNWRKHIMEALMKEDFNGTLGRVKFDSNGNAFRGYDIMVYNMLKYKKLAYWKHRINLLEKRSSIFKNTSSSCSSVCGRGEVRVQRRDSPVCCHLCRPCGVRQHSTVVTEFPVTVTPSCTEGIQDQDMCIDSPDQSTPNRKRNGRISLPVKYFDGTWSKLLTCLSGMGIVLTCIIIGTFIVSNKSAVIRASSRELAYILLIGILLCYSLIFIILSNPSKSMCGITRFGIGFCFSICYGAIFTRTLRIARLFYPKELVIGPCCMSSVSQIAISLGIASLEACLALLGLMMDNPKLKRFTEVSGTNPHIFYVCQITRYDVVGAYTYNILLIILCTVYAFKTRKVPTNFNEARYLGIVMSTTCVLWITFIPIYSCMRTEESVIAICLHVFANATCILFGIFGPKLYIHFFKSNTKERYVSARRLDPKWLNTVVGGPKQTLLTGEIFVLPHYFMKRSPNIGIDTGKA